MKTFLMAAASGLALTCATPALAADMQDAPAAAAPAQISAERHALALAAVDAYWPQGLSSFTTDYFLNTFADEILYTPIGQLVEKYGVIEMAGDVAEMMKQIEAMEAEARAKECGDTCEEEAEAEAPAIDISPEQMLKGMVAMFEDQRLIDIMAAKDEHLEERIKIVRAVVGEEMPKYAAAAEPKMRQHFATLFARRFNDQELRDIAAFAKTPTGQKYARQQWVMWSDPAYFRALFAGAPESLAMGKAMMEKLDARMAHLPPMFPKPEVKDEAGEEAETATAAELIEQAEMLEADAAEMLEEAAALRAEAAAM